MRETTSRMGLLGWLKRKAGGGEEPGLAAWRRAWAAAASAPGDEHVPGLTARLEALGLSDDDVEIEREMLEALSQLGTLRAQVEAAGLPVLETGHRIVGTDACHFFASVSMPDDPTQPGGRLILTDRRAIFAGGSQATTVGWHEVVEVRLNDRDILLVMRDRATLHRFRCNTYADAMRGAFLARCLATSKSHANPEPRPPVP